jgi:hypothetical protein
MQNFSCQYQLQVSEEKKQAQVRISMTTKLSFMRQMMRTMPGFGK